MALNYAKIDKDAKLANPIVGEIMFECPTLSGGYVSFESDIKYNTKFREVPASAVQSQEYTSGAPTSAGTMSVFDAILTPAKEMFYMEFDPETLRDSSFNRDMKPGAWNTVSTEFEKAVIVNEYSKRMALDIEFRWYNQVTAATKAAVAALTAGTGATQVSTQEKALVASLPVGRFDGVLATMIYNKSNIEQVSKVGGRIKVVGGTKDAETIKAQYDKKFLAISLEALHSGVTQYIYAPYADKPLIDTYNNNVLNFKDAFGVNGTVYTFNNIEIKFVPIPNNTAFIGSPDNFKWCTDIVSDATFIKAEPIASNREDWFYKTVYTIGAHVINQKFNVLYVG
jgi:hypothetical protein